MYTHADPVAGIRRTVALCSLALLAACSGKEGRIDSGLKKSAEFVRDGDWDKASVEVRNVLQIDPKNARAFLIGAQVNEGQNDIQRAYANYLKATELKPDLNEAQIGLARLYVLAGDMARAEPAVRNALAADPKSAAARTLDAALMAKRGQTRQAADEARAIIKDEAVAPVDASVLLAGLLANEGKSAEALGVIENALKASPRNLGLLQVAAQISGSVPQGDPLASKADVFFKSATLQLPKNDDLWRAWAAHHMRRGEIDAAETVLRDAVTAKSGDSKRRLDLLNFLSSRRGLSVAEKEFRAAIAASPRDMGLRFALVDVFRGARRHGDAQAVLANIVDVSDDPASLVNAKSQLAAYQLSSGRIESARTLVAEVLKASPRDNAALILRGRINLIDGQAKDAVVDLRAVAKDQPGSVEVIGLLAQAHRRAGEPQLAREVLADAVKLRPEDADLRLLLAADRADAKEFRGAMSELDEGIRLTPDVARLYEGKAQLALAQKDVAGAEKALNALRTRMPRDVTGYVRLAQLHAGQNRIDAALADYAAASAAVPGEPLPYIASIGLLAGARRFDEASRMIEARQRAEPKNVLHAQLKGDVAIARRDLPAAEQAYRSAIVLAPNAPVGYVNTARVLGLRGDIAGALVVLDQGQKAAPDNLQIPLARAEWLTKAKRFDEAIAGYEILLQRTPDDENVINNLAFLLVENKADRGSAERALALASRFADSRNPGQLDSLGWIHHKLGQYGKAVPLLEKAVALAPSSAVANLHLGQALVKSGNAARGKEFLRKALDSKADLPNLDEARSMLAQG
jgi:tetratricopeptide (TPR) repeat protein